MSELWQFVILAFSVLLSCIVVGMLGAMIYSVRWRTRSKKRIEADEAFFKWLTRHLATGESLKKLNDVDMGEVKK